MLTAALVLAAALDGTGGTASAQSIAGCWNYAVGNVYSSVCFNGSGGGTFNLDWANEDPERGLVKGSCNGTLVVESVQDSTVVFTVPYQEDACRIEADVMRLSQRDYSCEINDGEMVCSLVVYYDDGSIFQQSDGLVYAR
jgi:hypothetical protein